MDREEVVRDGLLSVPETGRFLSLSRSKVYLLMERGDLAYVKIGRARRIPRRAVIELAARNLTGGWRTGGANDG